MVAARQHFAVGSWLLCACAAPGGGCGGLPHIDLKLFTKRITARSGTRNVFVVRLTSAGRSPFVVSFGRRRRRRRMVSEIYTLNFMLEIYIGVSGVRYKLCACTCDSTDAERRRRTTRGTCADFAGVVIDDCRSQTRIEFVASIAHHRNAREQIEIIASDCAAFSGECPNLSAIIRAANDCDVAVVACGVK